MATPNTMSTQHEYCARGVTSGEVASPKRFVCSLQGEEGEGARHQEECKGRHRGE